MFREGHFAVGIMLGISVCLNFFLFSSRLDGQYSALFSGILGSLVGGAIAGIASVYAQHRSEAYLVASQDIQHRKEDVTNLLRLSAGIQQLAISARTVNSHIDKCFKHNEVNGGQLEEPWQIVLPAVGHAEPESYFPQDAFVTLAKFEQYDLMQRLILVERRAQNTLASFERYSSLKEAVSADLPKGAVSGDLGYAKLDRDQYNAFYPRLAELNQLIAQVTEYLEQDIQNLEAIISDLSAFFKLEFPDELPQMEIV